MWREEKEVRWKIKNRVEWRKWQRRSVKEKKVKWRKWKKVEEKNRKRENEESR